MKLRVRSQHSRGLVLDLVDDTGTTATVDVLVYVAGPAQADDEHRAAVIELLTEAVTARAYEQYRAPAQILVPVEVRPAWHDSSTAVLARAWDEATEGEGSEP